MNRIATAAEQNDQRTVTLTIASTEGFRRRARGFAPKEVDLYFDDLAHTAAGLAPRE